MGGGEPSASWQLRVAALPVVTEDGILHTGGDGGTAQIQRSDKNGVDLQGSNDSWVS